MNDCVFWLYRWSSHYIDTSLIIPIGNETLNIMSCLHIEPIGHALRILFHVGLYSYFDRMGIKPVPFVGLDALKLGPAGYGEFSSLTTSATPSNELGFTVL